MEPLRRVHTAVTCPDAPALRLLGDFPRDTFRGHFGGNGDVLHLNDGGSYTAA